MLLIEIRCAEAGKHQKHAGFKEQDWRKHQSSLIQPVKKEKYLWCPTGLSAWTTVFFLNKKSFP